MGDDSRLHLRLELRCVLAETHVRAVAEEIFGDCEQFIEVYEENTPGFNDMAALGIRDRSYKPLRMPSWIEG